MEDIGIIVDKSMYVFEWKHTPQRGEQGDPALGEYSLKVEMLLQDSELDVSFSVRDVGMDHVWSLTGTAYLSVRQWVSKSCRWQTGTVVKDIARIKHEFEEMARNQVSVIADRCRVNTGEKGAYRSRSGIAISLSMAMRKTLLRLAWVNPNAPDPGALEFLKQLCHAQTSEVQSSPEWQEACDTGKSLGHTTGWDEMTADDVAYWTAVYDKFGNQPQV